MLTDTFIQLANKYSNDHNLATNLWLEIFTKYSDPKRQYHTIAHLEGMFNELSKVKENIEDWDTTLFAFYYHDIIYKASSGTNEANSAKLASLKLAEIGFPKDKALKCAAMILATKNHELSEDNDTNYLIDADLSILGARSDDYQQYAEQIRQEYLFYPDFMYNNGRKKALENFLKMESIFKTSYFQKKYEAQARLNIVNELESL